MILVFRLLYDANIPDVVVPKTDATPATGTPVTGDVVEKLSMSCLWTYTISYLSLLTLILLFVEDEEEESSEVQKSAESTPATTPRESVTTTTTTEKKEEEQPKKSPKKNCKNTFKKSKSNKNSWKWCGNWKKNQQNKHLQQKEKLLKKNK